MSATPLWRARTEALTHLRRKQPAQVKVLESLLSLIDSCIDEFEGAPIQNIYSRTCGITVLKAKNLGVGAYSLMLDGLAQEAGALLRPFIEYTELLTYFRLDPSRTDQVASNSLPSAGERAKAIQGFYKDFRTHLNLHASHSSYSDFSMSHLLVPGTLKFKKMQVMVPEVLETNIRDLSVQLTFLVQEAVIAMKPIDSPNIMVLAKQADKVKEEILEAHGISAA